MTINIFTDGASRGNPGEAGIGVAIYDEEILIEQIYKYLGKKTNNQAEYTAVIFALQKLKDLNYSKANLFSDSEFLVKQLNGQYKVKAPNIVPLYHNVKQLLIGLDITFNWIPRNKNIMADSLANKAIDEKKIIKT